MLQRWVVVNKQMEVEVYLVNQNTVWTAFFVNSELVLTLSRMVILLSVITPLNKCMQRT